MEQFDFEHTPGVNLQDEATHEQNGGEIPDGVDVENTFIIRVPVFRLEESVIILTHLGDAAGDVEPFRIRWAPCGVG